VAAGGHQGLGLDKLGDWRVHNKGDDVQASKLAELRLAERTFVLADEKKKFCLGCVGVDGGDDGYSPLREFGLVEPAEDNGLDEVGDDDVSETGGRVEKPGNQTTYGQAGGLAGAGQH
jgi:hypothetical protein